MKVLGLPLHVATERLTSEGCRVTAVEVRSKKGLDGSDCRVIAQKQIGQGEVTLQYARFITDVPDK